MVHTYNGMHCRCKKRNESSPYINTERSTTYIVKWKEQEHGVYFATNYLLKNHKKISWLL